MLCVKQLMRALTERVKLNYNKRLWRKNWQVKPLILLCQVVVKAIGSIHPVTQVQERICQFFTKAGFVPMATGSRS
jgi:phenylalanyl-tRNA synthetase alpha subunit